MSERTRRTFSTEEKVLLLRGHLVDRMPVSDLCNEIGLQPGLFYQWLLQVPRTCPALSPLQRRQGRLSRRSRAGSSWARNARSDPPASPHDQLPIPSEK